MSEPVKSHKNPSINPIISGIKSNKNLLNTLYSIKEFNENRPLTVAESIPIHPPSPKSRKAPKIAEKAPIDAASRFFNRQRLTLGNLIILSKDSDLLQKNPSTATGSRQTAFSPVITRPVTHNPQAILIRSRKSKPRTHSLVRKTEEEVLTAGLPDYLIKETLGKGAYATVRLALHIESSRKVAIKTYDKYQLIDPQKKSNMLREIEILKKLDHPHIVKLYETIDSSKHFHLIMEYVPGVSLYAYLKTKPNQCLEESESKQLFRQIISAIEYCHGRNIAHRDIKLDNILLDQKNNVKIIDFGFSTMNSQDEKSRVFCGTPSYMAPEIVGRRDYYGLQADIWALGILLYAMLIGKMPFKAYNDKELYRRIEKGIFILPNNFQESLKGLIAKMLEINPRRRPSARFLIEDEWVSSSGILRSTTQNVVCRQTDETSSIDLDIISGIVRDN